MAGKVARTLIGESAVAMAVLLAAAILTDSRPPASPPTPAKVPVAAVSAHR
jgi:hypothetical protein